MAFCKVIADMSPSAVTSLTIRTVVTGMIAQLVVLALRPAEFSSKILWLTTCWNVDKLISVFL